MLVMIVSMSVASLIVNDCDECKKFQKGREPSHSLGSRDYLIILFIYNLTTILNIQDILIFHTQS